MAEKLSWTELRRALAKRAGVSEKAAGNFLNAVQAQLIQGLKKDKQVKINGLGTFKLQAVAPRKSVNVSTGEEITIEGYNKMVFTPEAGVKELVETGVAPLPSAEGKSEAIDPIQKLGAQAEEIVDLLGDLGQSPEKKPKKKKKKAEEGKKETAEPEPVVAEPVKEPEPIVAEPVKEPEPIKEPVFIPMPTPEPAAKPKKKYHFVRDTLICVVILLLILLLGYFFLRQQLSDILRSVLQPAETEYVEQAGQESSEAVVANETVYTEENTTASEEYEPAEPAVEETMPAEAAEEPAKETQPSKKDLIPGGAISQEQILAEFLEASGELPGPTDAYPELITTEPMHQDSRLVWMSKRYYGAKVYWPYLFDANRDILSNPCKIEVGTPIRVPKLSKTQLDTTNAETKATIERLRIEAEEACR